MRKSPASVAFICIATALWGQSRENSQTQTYALDSGRVMDYFRISDEFVGNNINYDSALAYAEKAVELANSLESDFLITTAKAKRGNALARQGRYEEATKILKEVLTIAETGGYKEVVAKANSDLGFIHDMQDDLGSAAGFFIKSLAAYEGLDDANGMARAYMNMTSIFGQQEQFDKVKEYVGKAFAILERVDDLNIRGFVYYASSSQFTEIGYSEPLYLDSAVLIANEGLEFAYANDLKKRLGQFYMVLSAIHYIKEEHRYCIRYCDSIVNYQTYVGNTGLIHANLRYSDSYFGLGDNRRTLLYLDYADTIIRNINSGFYSMIVQERRYDLYKETRQFEPALAALEQLKQIEDSLLSLEKNEAINDLELKYESQLKEQRIAELAGLNEIKELKLNQQFIIGLSVLIIITLAGLVVFYRYRQRLTRQKELTSLHKQQLLRSQVNPHFIFNALTSIRGFLFDGKNAKEAISYLGKFAKLMRLVLDHSSREWVTLKEEVEALEIYLEIQKMRFSNGFEYELKIDPDIVAEQVKVPPLLAQPFVENAIEHGFRNIDYEGKVEFICVSEGNMIRFSIVDNGIGIDHVDADLRHESHALNIFKERMRLLGTKLKSNLTYLIEDLGTTGNATGTHIEYKLPLQKYA